MTDLNKAIANIRRVANSTHWQTDFRKGMLYAARLAEGEPDPAWPDLDSDNRAAIARGPFEIGQHITFKAMRRRKWGEFWKPRYVSADYVGCVTSVQVIDGEGA